MHHHLDTTKKRLVGKSLEKITRIDDSTVLIEFGAGEKCKLSVSGDCCSHSIFYEIEIPDDLKGALIEDVIEWSGEEGCLAITTADPEDVALEKVKASGIEFSPECNSVWNVVLKTNRGNALVRHINSSNGYYDGSTYYEFD